MLQIFAVGLSVISMLIGNIADKKAKENMIREEVDKAIKKQALLLTKKDGP